MNRAIKFRGKSIFGIHEWIYDSLLLLNGKTYICPDKAVAWNMTKYEVIPETIGQFTGLFDKNGKEIYEGDIIKGFDITIKVWYSEETASFMAEMKEPENDMVDILGGYDTARMEIVGRFTIIWN